MHGLLLRKQIKFAGTSAHFNLKIKLDSSNYISENGDKNVMYD